ncbi:hypothetical protein [Shimia aestuarii]|uniref:hypothetical protein n=1 Tax=Shimia aestuarii TaxID=254406 RepID=UPI001FB3920F|nr:hypothetical protein [Shimia aestuarii]
MATVPCILIATAAQAADLSAVLEAQGRGPGTFTSGRRLVAEGTTGPVVAYLAQDMSATAELEAAWRAFADSADLPDIGNNVWGENGVISSGDAQAASAGLTVHSVAGTVPSNWTASVLAGHGYEFEPEPEL